MVSPNFIPVPAGSRHLAARVRLGGISSPPPPTMQARDAEQDVEPYMTKMSCSKCQISYYIEPKSKPRCPLCDAEAKLVDLRQALTVQRNLVQRLEESVEAMRSHLDLVFAMRSALEITSSEDLAFLKSVLYRHRQDKGSVNLRTTHGKAIKRGRSLPPANGFLVQCRYGEIETHLCVSLGGLALAGYFDEAMQSLGQPTAMTLTMKALHETLTGET